MGGEGLRINWKGKLRVSRSSCSKSRSTELKHDTKTLRSQGKFHSRAVRTLSILLRFLGMWKRAESFRTQ